MSLVLSTIVQINFGIIQSHARCLFYQKNKIKINTCSAPNSKNACAPTSSMV